MNSDSQTLTIDEVIHALQTIKEQRGNISIQLQPKTFTLEKKHSSYEGWPVVYYHLVEN